MEFFNAGAFEIVGLANSLALLKAAANGADVPAKIFMHIRSLPSRFGEQGSGSSDDGIATVQFGG